MRPLEHKILEILPEVPRTTIHSETSQRETYSEEENQILLEFISELVANGFGFSSADFLENPKISKMRQPENWLNEEGTHFFKTLEIWLKIENYLVLKNESILNELEQILQETTTEVSSNSGVRLGGKYIMNPHLIRAVYLSKNENIISLFSKWLPTPKYIAEQQEESYKHIMSFASKTGLDSNEIINSCMQIQRIFRKAKRKQQESVRTNMLYVTYLQENQITAKQLIEKTNAAYQPQGNTELTKKILEIVNEPEFKLFSKISHLTAMESLKDIFDDCLYGRESLLKAYKSFRPASLQNADAVNGDGDVICFGPNGIDPKCATKKNTAQITFFADKMLVQNAFYKQLDFGYWENKMHRIDFAKYLRQPSYYFCIANDPYKLHIISEQNNIELNKIYGEFYTTFLLYNEFGEIIAYTLLPNILLISTQLDKIHRFLTLNFFQFIDNLACIDGASAEELKNDIYEKISKIPDEKLFDFLKELGERMASTTEFNIFGAHKIDFSSIKSIQPNHEFYYGDFIKQSNISYPFNSTDSITENYPASQSEPYKLNMKNFISRLNNGDVSELKKSQQSLPTLFKSYRFLDYLLSQVSTCSDCYNILKDTRSSVRAPVTVSWMQEIDKKKSSKNSHESNHYSLDDRYIKSIVNTK